MNPVNYTHPCGLMFTTERLMSYNEDASHDICIVCLWLPNSAEDPMVLINWYCGEPNLECTKEVADKYIAALKPETIVNLLDCQDMDTDPEFPADLPAYKRLIYRLVAVKSRLNYIELNGGDPNAVDRVTENQYFVQDTMRDLVDELIGYINTHR